MARKNIAGAKKMQNSRSREIFMKRIKNVKNKIGMNFCLAIELMPGLRVSCTGDSRMIDRTATCTSKSMDASCGEK